MDKRKLLKDSNNTFSSRIDYYRQEWHDYYPTITALVPEGASVLDIGCGRGGLLVYLRDALKCRVVGIDISEEAQKICAQKGIRVITSDAELDNIPGKYDAIILAAVFEHFIDPVSFLKKIRNNINDGGRLIIGVPNFSHLSARIKYLLGKNIKQYGTDHDGEKLGVQPYGHIQFYNKRTLEYMFEKTGFKPVAWKYYRPVKWKVTPDKKLISRIISALLLGLYQIPHNLFSIFMTVRAEKTN